MPVLTPHRLLFGLALAQGAISLLAWTLTAVPTSEGTGWHVHELVCGYALAVAGGFLLTRLSRDALLAIAALWVSARLAYLVPSSPVPLRAVLSLAATAAIGLLAAKTFLRGAKTAGSLVFPAVMISFLAAEFLFQLGDLAALQGIGRAGRWLGLGVVILLIAAMGGRLVGAAASGAAQRSGGARIPLRPGLEQALLASLAIGFLAEAFGLPRFVPALLLGLGGGLIGVRLLSWVPGLRRSQGDVLAVATGQGWLCIGLLAWAAAEVGLLPGLPGTAALHLATIGGIGGTTLVMMMRAAAQREARPMPVRAAPVVAALMGLAALLRAFGPPALYGAAALVWALATLLAARWVFARR